MDKHLMQPADKKEQERKTEDKIKYGEIVRDYQKTRMQKMNGKADYEKEDAQLCDREIIHPVIT